MCAWAAAPPPSRTRPLLGNKACTGFRAHKTTPRQQRLNRFPTAGHGEFRARAAYSYRQHTKMRGWPPRRFTRGSPGFSARVAASISACLAHSRRTVAAASAGSLPPTAFASACSSASSSCSPRARACSSSITCVCTRPERGAQRPPAAAARGICVCAQGHGVCAKAVAAAEGESHVAV